MSTPKIVRWEDYLPQSPTKINPEHKEERERKINSYLEMRSQDMARHFVSEKMKKKGT